MLRSNVAQQLGATVVVPLIDNGRIEFAHLADPVGTDLVSGGPKSTDHNDHARSASGSRAAPPASGNGPTHETTLIIRQLGHALPLA